MLLRAHKLNPFIVLINMSVHKFHLRSPPENSLTHFSLLLITFHCVKAPLPPTHTHTHKLNREL